MLFNSEFYELYVNTFEKSIKDVLSIYLINSANEQGLIDDKMKDYIIRSI